MPPHRRSPRSSVVLRVGSTTRAAAPRASRNNPGPVAGSRSNSNSSRRGNGNRAGTASSSARSSTRSSARSSATAPATRSSRNRSSSARPAPHSDDDEDWDMLEMRVVEGVDDLDSFIDDEEDLDEPALASMLSDARNLSHTARAIIRRIMSRRLYGDVEPAFASDAEDEEGEWEEDEESDEEEVDEEEQRIREREDAREADEVNVPRTEAFGECPICSEEQPTDPVGCIYCRQLVGCRKCADRWFRASKQGEGGEAGCPLCRSHWIGMPEVGSMLDLI